MTTLKLVTDLATQGDKHLGTNSAVRGDAELVEASNH